MLHSLAFILLAIAKTPKKPLGERARRLDEVDERWSLLMVQIQAGDKQALRQLFVEIEPSIVTYCCRRANYLGIPEEVLQQSL
ncbi:MAG: hypothetical protein KDD62_09855, partial [Bdellovibrionales bacterium]|nr:hypothetical protein [Bdellovibrionales bacterium]